MTTNSTDRGHSTDCCYGEVLRDKLSELVRHDDDDDDDDDDPTTDFDWNHHRRAYL